MNSAVVWSGIHSDSDFLRKCILILYGQQLASEQDTHTTHEDNGVGFNKTDAPFLSEMALKILRHEKLSSDELSLSITRMAKYARQLGQYITEDRL